MLTLQILDGGDTFFRPLEGRSLTLGSHSSADVRLSEEGVSGRHARIDPLDDGSYKIVDLDSQGGTMVNGQLVAQVRLQLGDRIELGRAVIVLGKRVQRRATPADLAPPAELSPLKRVGRKTRRRAVASASARTEAPEMRLRRAHLPNGGRPRAVSRRADPVRWIAFGALGLVLVAGLMFLAGLDRDVRPPMDLAIRERIEKVQLDQARQAIDVDRSWAGRDEARNAILDEYLAQVESLEQAIVELRQRTVDEASETTWARQHESLTALRESEDRIEAIAARRVLSELADLRRKARSGRSDVVAVGSDSRSSRPSEATGPPSKQSTERSEAELEVAARLAEAESVYQQGQFRRALEMLNYSLAETPSDLAEPLRALHEEIEQDALAASQRLIARARDRGADGAELLRSELPRFPTAGEFAALRRTLESLEASVDRVSSAGETVRMRLLELRTRARTELIAGYFERSAATLVEAARLVGDDDPSQSQALKGRADDIRCLADVHAAVAAAVADAPRTATLDDGRTVELVSASDRAFVTSDDESVSLSDLATEKLPQLLASIDASPAAWLGGAVLAYREDRRDRAEHCLRSALEADRSLRRKIDGIIARGRGEPLDDRGYRLVSGAFVSAGELEAAEAIRRLESSLAHALRRSGSVEERERILGEALAGGPEALKAVVQAMRRQAMSLARSISSDRFRKVYDRLLAKRIELDEARKHALALIFDEDAYFYPYKPPAVSSERASEYRAVQEEVDRRLDAVREIWEGRHPSAAVPKRLLEKLETFDWIKSSIADLGGSVSSVSDEVRWLELVDQSQRLSLTTLCRSRAELEGLRHQRRVEVFNAALFEELGLSKGERALVDLTNRYRVMLGRAPLALNPNLFAACRGHADEMDRLGYFSHYSPVPDRKTPFDRMRLAGYRFGIGENLAKRANAESAHHGWAHSSGHHRNLLSAGHSEFALAGVGNLWVQNFGGGREFKDNPSWTE